MRCFLIWFIFIMCIIGNFSLHSNVYSADADVISFSEFSKVISFMEKCLEEDDYKRLCDACVGSDRVGYKPCLPDLTYGKRAFNILKAMHEKVPLHSMYRGMEFPTDRDTYELSCHMIGLECIYIDFIKKDNYWYLCDIYLLDRFLNRP